MGVILNRAGAIFVPVSNIEKARDWYCALLGMEADYKIIAGHLCCIPLDNNGSNLVLDSKIYSEDAVYRNPAFHFNTDDIEAAYRYVEEQGIELVTGIENGHWFNLKDPDGNLLMICKC
ncbi:VOC family protein [Paenibacillus turpanensis]|uniref:VOC family protein n=1 Tax=Paenibacillus turpanensis TaxID=2689078 RepID=UPI001408D778|nr:VOC family protein [Paenibacillus turpanensis]